MKLIIGLGNPGEKYKNNRHNVGQMVVDKIKIKDFVTKKTFVFMNSSGEEVKRLLTTYSLMPTPKAQAPLNALFVVHDDLDIKLGEFKIQKGVGPKLHYGVDSIDKALGTKDYWRVRVGIDNRPHSAEAPRGEDYVLQDFTQEEQEVLQNVISQICKKLATL